LYLIDAYEEHTLPLNYYDGQRKRKLTTAVNAVHFCWRVPKCRALSWIRYVIDSHFLSPAYRLKRDHETALSLYLGRQVDMLSLGLKLSLVTAAMISCLRVNSLSLLMMLRLTE